MPTPWQTHEAILAQIEEVGFPVPDAINYPKGNELIPPGRYERDRESGMWVRSGPVPGSNHNINWINV